VSDTEPDKPQAEATAAGAGADPSPAAEPPTHPGKVPRTRTSAAHVGIGVGLVVLALVLTFIIQNLDQTSVHFMTLRFRLPVGVVMLGAALAGGVLVLLVSLARMTQIRLILRRERVAHKAEQTQRQRQKGA
jgi:uncharacterized integral membrane protein